MTVITRFAPSPTGLLHIGGARTALFNWLYAKNQGGKFLLRIEDTDRERSTEEAIDAIINGLEWLGLSVDDDIVFQSKRQARHKEVVEQLLQEGKAYHCYTTPEELDELRKQAREEGKVFRYDGRWRDRDPSEAPAGVKPVVRIKAPQDGELVIPDKIQGEVKVAYDQLDDMVLMRSDGTPTYMLAVVVDDHDMGITDVIRGDDHLTNTFRQAILYQALGWDMPHFSHMSLIHGPDGAKLSKRHGALGVEAYRDMGMLPEAMRNYLLRLGWSHGDDEVISTEQAIEWFNLENIGKSPARFDMDKLNNLNSIYIKNMDNNNLLDNIKPLIKQKLDYSDQNDERIIKGLESLKQRINNLNDLTDSTLFYAKTSPLEMDEKAEKLLAEGGRERIDNLYPDLEALADWNHDTIQPVISDHCKKHEIKMGEVMMPIRAALTGSTQSPSVPEVMEILGKEESLKRLKDQI